METSGNILITFSRQMKAEKKSLSGAKLRQTSFPPILILCLLMDFYSPLLKSGAILDFGCLSFVRHNVRPS